MLPLLFALLLATWRIPPPLVLGAATWMLLLVLLSLERPPHPAAPLKALRLPSVMFFFPQLEHLAVVGSLALCQPMHFSVGWGPLHTPHLTECTHLTCRWLSLWHL